MNNKIIIGIIILGLVVIIGMKLMNSNTDEAVVEIIEIPIPVETANLEKESIDNVLTYQGMIASEKVEQISFKSTARLDYINGEIGDKIEEGTLLIQMNTEDIELSLEAANKQYNSAAANYNQAINGTSQEDIDLATISVEKAYDYVEYLEDQLAKMTVLNGEGTVSDQTLDEIELELNLAKSDYELAVKSLEKAEKGADDEVIEAAKAQMDLAAVDIDLQKSLLEDASYITNSEKVIVEKLYEEGELVSAGYPVVILRSMAQVVEIGVSIKDIDSVYIGQSVEVFTNNSDDRTVEGEITRISEIPDSDHYLYEVEVLLKDPTFKVGEIVRCDIKVDTEEAMLIPLSTINKDSFDYIYIAKEDRVAIQKIEIIDINGDQAIVKGVEEGTQLIISNLNKIEEQSKINIVEE